MALNSQPGAALATGPLLSSRGARQAIALGVAGALAFSSSAARATITQVIGGPGGAPFMMQCPPGQAAVGIAARAGSFVDAVAVLCRTPSGALTRSEWAGGTGGGPQEIYCPTGEEISAAYFTFTRGNDLPRQFVNTIGIVCGTPENRQASHACILSGDTYEGRFFEHCGARTGWGDIGTDLHVRADPLACPQGEVLTGLHGRAYKFVDAIGLVCGAGAGNPMAAGPDNAGEPTAPNYGASDQAADILDSNQAAGAAASPYAGSVSTSAGTLGKGSAAAGAIGAGSAVVPEQPVPIPSTVQRGQGDQIQQQQEPQTEREKRRKERRDSRVKRESDDPND